jgi:hypothetical protein
MLLKEVNWDAVKADSVDFIDAFKEHAIAYSNMTATAVAVVEAGVKTARTICKPWMKAEKKAKKAKNAKNAGAVDAGEVNVGVVDAGAGEGRLKGDLWEKIKKARMEKAAVEGEVNVGVVDAGAVDAVGEADAYEMGYKVLVEVMAEMTDRLELEVRSESEAELPVTRLIRKARWMACQFTGDTKRSFHERIGKSEFLMGIQ